MNKLTKEKKTQLFMVGFGTAVLLGLVWFFGILELKKRKNELDGKIVAARKKEEDATKLFKQSPQIREELEALNKKLAVVEDRMVAGDTNVWIRTETIRFKSTGVYKVDMPQFSTAEGVRIGVLPEFPYKAAKYRVSGTAYYHDFGRFLADFENYFPNVRVQNLDLATVKSVEPEHRERLAFSMELVALIKPPAPKPATP